MSLDMMPRLSLLEEDLDENSFLLTRSLLTYCDIIQIEFQG